MISDKPRKRRPVELLQHVALLFVISTIPRQRGDKRRAAEGILSLVCPFWSR
jgi:hypothetical protein